MIDADHNTRTALVAALHRAVVPGFTISVTELPGSPPPLVDRATPAVAAARAAYLEQGDFETCASLLEPLDVPKILAEGRRNLVARVLVWRTACAWGRMDHAAAHGIAAQLAGFGLDLPPDAGAITPDVEAVLVAAMDRAGAAPRRPLAIVGVVGARLAIDGRRTECTLPCTVDMLDGDHVVAVNADGYAPAWRVVRVPAPGPITIGQPAATPALAAAQWRTRAGRGWPRNDNAGLVLVAQAVAQRRVLYLTADRRRLHGALVVDGVVRARGEVALGQASALAHDLTVRGGLVNAAPLWRRPAFWLAVAATAAITTAIVLEPEPVTRVGF